MRTIEELLEEAPAMQSLAPQHRAVIAGCGRNSVFEPGEYLMREGDPADIFYVIREGSAALETFVPQRGAVTIQTLDDGELVGWSWLVPPYRVAFDVRALTRIHAIAFDGACLRGKSEQDPALGYDLLKMFAAVIVARLQRTRVQLLDVYGPASAL
jgi:CRP/FNR family transcriptional regulator, cyclic AMP receptor protein